jgi:hypothetical protein
VTASPLTSPIAGVSDDAWRAFVAAMTVRAAVDAPGSKGHGCFDVRPRRLEEIGLEVPRTFAECYEAFEKSVAAYVADIDAGRVAVPEGVSRAGAVAILQRGGRGALAAYPDLFSDTREVYDRARECF